ncbi:MAG: site-specific integrase [Kiritimatiellae bacterium]|nr:site-specific integrase [Kiritimatiellia bacterium]
MAKKARCRGKGEGTLTLRGRTWFARWTVNGKTFTRTTGTSDRREAEGKLAEFTAPFRLSNDVETLEAVTVKINGVKAEIEEWKDNQPAMTLLQAWTAFKTAPKGKTPRGRVIMPGARTLADYEGRWNAFCTWMEAKYPKTDKDGNRIPWEMRQIGKEHAERYIAEISGEKSANTRNKSLTFLRLVFKVLAEDARIKTNPFENMDAAPLAVTRKRPLTMTELSAISKNLVGKGELETLFSLGYYTGARLGDCVLMRWANIDMGARKIRYTPHKTAKGNKEITLNISPALFSLLDQTPSTKRKGLVLPELGEMYRKDPSAVSKRIQQVFIDAGIETGLEVEGYGKKVACVGFHSLRHAHITALLEGGMPMDAVRQQAGHATIGMTAHYYHAGKNTLQAMSDALPAFGHANTLPAGTDATGAKLDAVLAMLDGLSDQELKALIGSAKDTLKKRMKSD